MTSPDLYVPFDDDPSARLVWSAPRLSHTLEMWEHTRHFPDGTTGLHYRVKSSGENYHPGILVLPVKPDGSIGMLKAWRPNVGNWIWETPRGFGETADPLANAAQELREEAGLVAVDLVHAGRIYTETGFLADPIDVVIALIGEPRKTGKRKAAAPDDPASVNDSGDAHELRDFRFVSRADLRNMILAGEIIDAITLAALALLDAATG